MDSIFWTSLFVYLVVLVIDFIWMTKVDTSRGEESSFARDGLNLIESALWPVILPLQIIFLILINIYELILKIILFINELIHEIIRRHRG